MTLLLTRLFGRFHWMCIVYSTGLIYILKRMPFGIFFYFFFFELKFGNKVLVQVRVDRWYTNI